MALRRYINVSSGGEETMSKVERANQRDRGTVVCFVSA